MNLCDNPTLEPDVGMDSFSDGSMLAKKIESVSSCIMGMGLQNPPILNAVSLVNRSPYQR